MKSWLKYPWLGGAVTALLLSVSVSPAARAESSDVAALRQEVARLEQIVQRLDARVEQIEKRLPMSSAAGSPGAAAAEAAAPQAPAPVASKDSLRDRWHRISHGMTVQAVEDLLGRPQRTMAVNAKTVWYYTYPGVGSGSVVFAHDGGVDDWQSPPFSTWW